MTRRATRLIVCCSSCEQAPPLSMLAEDMSCDDEEDEGEDEGEDEEEGRRL